MFLSQPLRLLDRRLKMLGRNKRIIVGIVAVLVLVAGITGYTAWRALAAGRPLTLSGTIEATEIRLRSQFGGQVRRVTAFEGDSVHAGQALLFIASAAGNTQERITSPIDGVVLERLIEPGEVAPPDGTLMVIANLDALTLKVYLPEDRYGQVNLGATYPVTVDSFPGETFRGTVTHIADQAEFTPRNVQTVEGRKSTVSAVTLDLAPTNGKLKPGMPADVSLPAR
jgi:multidrug resistance efflux pump